MTKKDDKVADTNWANTPILICACGSTDWIQKPSGGIVCRHCNRPIKESSTKRERP